LHARHACEACGTPRKRNLFARVLRLINGSWYVPELKENHDHTNPPILGLASEKVHLEIEAEAVLRTEQ